MKFFQSPVVRAEMAEISELQEEVYSNIFKFPSMKKEDQLYHVEILTRLIEKQQILYARLSLSDDPDALKMKENIIESASMMGIPNNVDMSKVFDQMSTMVETLKIQIDKNQFSL
jgi:glycine cleavage system regulatory protein